MLEQLATVATVDTAHGEMAASPWVELAVTIFAPVIIGLVGYLLVAWQRRAARDATDNLRVDQAERDITQLKAQAAAQSISCGERHSRLDVRLAEDKTTLALIHQTLAAQSAMLKEIKSMLFTLYNFAGLTPSGKHLKYQTLQGDEEDK